jgi:hypothetical protein
MWAFVWQEIPCVDKKLMKKQAAFEKQSLKILETCPDSIVSLYHPELICYFRKDYDQPACYPEKIIIALS